MSGTPPERPGGGCGTARGRPLCSAGPWLARKHARTRANTVQHATNTVGVPAGTRLLFSLEAPRLRGQHARRSVLTPALRLGAWTPRNGQGTLVARSAARSGHTCCVLLAACLASHAPDTQGAFGSEPGHAGRFPAVARAGARGGLIPDQHMPAGRTGCTERACEPGHPGEVWPGALRS